ncbi:molybdenum cofactor guanylyltransferase MobA [Plastoroseomonas arctica]|uniref:molybdenum cofactor guanylyltransferase MobA n=1 Tax=Plastoroseomonas arctica TaxID=1509237 RepID=UPI002484ADAD|nr:molybdenum cofactor guanylyltransferase MobA [Plastoroseomonas arctica]
MLGVILAGGLARRMGGGDKPLRVLGGRPMLAHVIERLGPQVGRMVINANGDGGRFAAFGLEVVGDDVPGHPGPLAGILAGLAWAGREGFAGVVTVPGDSPFLPLDLVGRLVVAGQLACARSGGFAHPPVGVWPVALEGDLRAAVLAGERKIDRWTARHGVVEVEWDVAGGDPFFNANTPEELAEAESLLLRRPGTIISP